MDVDLRTLIEPCAVVVHAIEKAKEIFDRIFWKWVKKEFCVPQDFDCETWEELLQECWEDGAFDDVVSCESIVFEEDKN